MIHEAFSDHFAHKNNYLTIIDARIKIVFVAAAILLILFSKNLLVPCAGAVFSLAALFSIKIPTRIIFFRLIAPLGMAAVVLLMQLFILGGSLAKGLLILGKVIGCSSFVMFLSMTTPVNMLLGAGLWFRIPRLWIEITMLTYRYIFVLLENAITIREAQQIRLGYSSISRSLRSTGELAGSLVIRAYDQSLVTHESMQLRGFNGTSNLKFEKKFVFRDILHSFVCFAILSFLFFLESGSK